MSEAGISEQSRAGKKQQGVTDPGLPVFERKRILVVDDYEPTRELLGHVFRKRYDLEFAADGETALRLAQETRPHLILMDIRMPKRDGLATTRILKENAELAEIPVFALSAHEADGTEEEQALEAGCEAYFRKPFSPIALRDAVVERLGDS